MSTQAEKYSLAIAGEFFVAAQLQRMGARASVTYGNAKRADVVVVGQTSGKSVTIEVKSSGTGRWPIGNRVPAPSNQLWVFVHVPKTHVQPPQYYVVTQQQLNRLLAPIERAYLARFKAKHGVAYGNRPGVATANRTVLAPFQDAWSTILRRL